MKKHYSNESKKTMQKKWDDQIENKKISFIPQSSVLKGATILPSVWKMKRKRGILIIKIKVHGPPEYCWVKDDTRPPL